MIGRILVAAILSICLVNCGLAGGPAGFTLARETTYVTEPLDREGYVDYEIVLNRALAEGISPQDNAAALLWRALGPQLHGGSVLPEFFEWLKLPAPPQRGSYFVGLSRYAEETLKIPNGQAINELLKRRSLVAKWPWAAKDHPDLAGWMKANEAPLDLVVEATQRSEFFYPIVSRKSGEEGWYGLIGALMPGIQECKELAFALAVRAMRGAGEGKFEAARQDLFACHRLGRLLARRAEPTVYQVGVAIDQIASEAHLALLQRAAPGASLARDWLRDVEQLPELPSAGDWFDLGGRLMFLDAVLRVRRNGAKFVYVLMYVDPRIQPKPRSPDSLPRLAVDGPVDWDAILRTGNAWYDRMAAAHRIKDRAEREKEFDRIGDDLRGHDIDGGTLVAAGQALDGGMKLDQEASAQLCDALIGFFLQGFRQVRRAADIDQQMDRNLRVTLALAAYRAEHKRYPVKLEALAREYPDTSLDDLFSGKPLIYRPAENGYLFYSVGINGLDEGGQTSGDAPAGDDLRVRVPFPAPKRN